MQKILRMFVIFFVLSSLVGCSILPRTYPFFDQPDSIESIELLYHPLPEGTFTLKDYMLVRQLNPDEIEPFMEALQAIETKKASMSPVRDFGVYVVRVTYLSGEKEIFGDYHIEFLESGEKETGVGFYYFVGDTFEELFLTYAGGYDMLNALWQTYDLG